MAVNVGDMFNGALEHKLWGWTKCTGLTDTMEVAIAFMNNGWQCSKHYHQYKWNRFTVIVGELEVIVYRNGREESIILKSRETLNVAPGLWHRMRALTNVYLEELYWVTEGKIDTKDIIREDNGGQVPVNIPTSWIDTKVEPTMPFNIKTDVEVKIDDIPPEKLQEIADWTRKEIERKFSEFMYPEVSKDGYSTAIQDIKVSADLSREPIFELGRKKDQSSPFLYDHFATPKQDNGHGWGTTEQKNQPWGDWPKTDAQHRRDRTGPYAKESVISPYSKFYDNQSLNSGHGIDGKSI